MPNFSKRQILTLVFGNTTYNGKCFTAISRNINRRLTENCTFTNNTVDLLEPVARIQQLGEVFLIKFKNTETITTKITMILNVSSNSLKNFERQTVIVFQRATAK